MSMQVDSDASSARAVDPALLSGPDADDFDYEYEYDENETEVRAAIDWSQSLDCLASNSQIHRPFTSIWISPL